jgi:hypothetical protein
VSTPRQQAANARNAKKSTGPRSAAGRAKSAGNARRHGLSAAAAEGTEAEPILADLLGDFPTDFAEDNRNVLETLASTQARLARAGALEAMAVREVLRHAPTLGEREVAREGHAAAARRCAGMALTAARRPIGPYGAADFRHMAATFRLATKFEPECAQALERLRKLSRYTRDGEALRRKLIKSLAELARDSAAAHG